MHEAQEWMEVLKETINVVDRIAQRERTRARYAHASNKLCL